MKTYKEIYRFPLMLSNQYDYVFDSDYQIVFQFREDRENVLESLLKIINGTKKKHNNGISFKYVNGSIYNDLNERVLTLCNWWFLTEKLELKDEEASNVQNTLGEFITKQLNN